MALRDTAAPQIKWSVSDNANGSERGGELGSCGIDNFTGLVSAAAISHCGGIAVNALLTLRMGMIPGG
jgi:hypothetical protein